MIKKTDKLTLISLLLPVMGVATGLFIHLFVSFLGFDAHYKGSTEKHDQAGNGRNVRSNGSDVHCARGYSYYDVDFYPSKPSNGQ